MSNSKQTAKSAGETPSGADAYPQLRDVFSKILQGPGVPETGVMHLIVHTFADGSATWSCQARGEDDWRGGFVE